MEWSLGQLVISKQGRDKGQYYIIVKMESTRCYLADGRNAVLAKPKKKNYKHLQGTTVVFTNIGEKLVGGNPPFDLEIRGAIKRSLEAKASDEEVGSPESQF